MSTKNNIPAELLDRLHAMNLPLDGEINRPQFAALGGVTTNKLHYAMRFNKGLAWPKNCGHRTRQKFRTLDVLAFLAATPLTDIKVDWKPSRKEIPKTVRTRFDNDTTAAFLRGDYAPADVHRKHARRKLAARIKSPKTQTVRVRGADLWLSGV